MKPIRASLFVVGTSIDPHIDAVLSRLGDIPVCRLDVDNFPRETQVSIEIVGVQPTLIVDTGRQVFDVSTPDVAWFRRFGKPGLSPNLDPAYEKFARDEAEQTVQGMLDLCTPTYWINAFRAARIAASKPYQYVIAANCGLTTLPTILTNSQGRLEMWLQKQPDEVIIKSLSRPLLTDETSVHGRTFAYTSRIKNCGSQSQKVRTVPSQLQPLIRGTHEVRVTSMSGEHIAVSIKTIDPVEDRHDWRATQDTAEYCLTELPRRIASGLSELMTTLNLQYAASDFIVTDSGEWIFLESNPHGAWLWMESDLGYPLISESISSKVLHMLESKSSCKIGE